MIHLGQKISSAFPYIMPEKSDGVSHRKLRDGLSGSPLPPLLTLSPCVGEWSSEDKEEVDGMECSPVALPWAFPSKGEKERGEIKSHFC